MEGLTAILVPLGSFAMVVWIIRTVIAGRRRREELQVLATLHGRLLDKIDDGPALREFMESDGGRRLLSSFARERGVNHERILASVHAGVVLTALGIAFLGIGQFARVNDEGGVSILGTVIFALGAGFLISSALSHHLSKKWGLFDERGTDLASRP